MNEIVIALLVLFGVVAGPLFLSELNSRQRRREKVEDYARQDKVASQAAEAARLLEERQNVTAARAAEVARKLLESNERVATESAAASAITNGKLAQIHELVNSNLTAQMQEGHVSLVQQEILMREVIRLNREAGREPSTEAIAALAAVQVRINEIASQLQDRASATIIADAQISKK